MPLLRFQRHIVDSAGNVLDGAEVEIRDSETAALASLFEDEDGITPKANPLTTDLNGYAFAYLGPGRFSIKATKNAQVVEWPDFDLANNYNDILAAAADQSYLKSETIRRVSTLADLEGAAGQFDGDAAYLVGRTTAGDGGEGNFRWDGSDLSSTLVLSSVTSTSVDDATDTITSAGHGLSNGDGVVPRTAVNGLSVNTVYWVVNATTDTYQLATTFGGAAFDLTGTANFTVDHLLDPFKGICVTAPDDLTGINGAWKRNFETLSFEMFGAKADYDGVSGTDNTPAFYGTISYAISNFPATIIPSDGTYFLSDNLPAITKPISIIGRWNTFFQFAPISGQAMTLRNVGFNDESTVLPKTGDRAFDDSDNLIFPCAISGITLLGDRSTAGAHHGFVCEGNVDFLHLDVECMYFNGRGVWFGKQSGGLRGNLRESSQLRVRTRNCGRADSTASVTFEVANSGIADSINLIKDIDIEVVFPHGRGIEFVDNRVDSSGSGIYGLQGNLMVHGPQLFTQNGHLLLFIGDITECDFNTNIAFDVNNTPSILFDRNSSNGESPSNIRLNTRMPSSIKGFDFKYGGGITINHQGGFVQKELMEVRDTFTGHIQFNVSGNAAFQSHANSFTLNGTDTTPLPSWDGGFLGVTGLGTFMPLQSADGDGDTMRAAILGEAGLLTRSGDATAGTETYTFTPDGAPSNFFVPDNSVFSKCVVSTTNEEKVSGRYKPSHIFDNGVNFSGAHTSKRLLQVGFYNFWIGGGLLRKNYGRPSSSTSGEAIAQWSKAFVGATSTPDVRGRSLLFANYSSPTTITNMLNGIDGQQLSVVSDNTNCTIQDNTNIITISGSDIVMAENSAVQFVYSEGLSAWVQV